MRNNRRPQSATADTAGVQTKPPDPVETGPEPAPLPDPLTALRNLCEALRLATPHLDAAIAINRAHGHPYQGRPFGGELQAAVNVVAAADVALAGEAA